MSTPLRQGLVFKGFGLVAALLAGCTSHSKAEGGAGGTGGSRLGSFAGAGDDQSSSGSAGSAGRAGLAGQGPRVEAGSDAIASSGAGGASGSSAAGASGSSAAGTSGSGAGGAGGSGAAGAAGSHGGQRTATFAIGADITWVQQDELRGATYSDGARKDILQLLADHGFNYIRLRTFVDPKAADGYDKSDGHGDLAHTIAFGQRIKRAGMGLLIDFHYSDNWADPGKQCVPLAWQNLTTIAALARAVHDYTKDAIGQLIAAGARPDMVQIGNEITPGMLLHRCDGEGQPTGNNPVRGSSSDWSQLGMLLQAGSRAVKETDPGISVMLHIDRCDDAGTSRDFIENALQQGVEFDVFGESCYTAYQGRPEAWRSTFMQLAEQFPQLKFVIAEYGPEQRAANDVLFDLPDQRGLGTFNWEPTHPGPWNSGHALFDVAGNGHTATMDLALYDAMKTAFADRL